MWTRHPTNFVRAGSRFDTVAGCTDRHFDEYADRNADQDPLGHTDD
jgi:hypothetical protein